MSKLKCQMGMSWLVLLVKNGRFKRQMIGYKTWDTGTYHEHEIHGHET